AAGIRYRAADPLTQVDEVVGDAALHRLLDHRVGGRADALGALEPAILDASGDLLIAQGAERRESPAERLGLVRGRKVTLEQERDLVEGIGGSHGGSLRRRGWVVQRPIRGKTSSAKRW